MQYPPKDVQFDPMLLKPTMELNSMYECASGSPTGGDARLLRLEVVRVSSAAPVRKQQAPLGVLVEIRIHKSTLSSFLSSSIN